ncbi:hypothetical protein BCV69DRAFT_279952 [Microstroma glucosiphilum]|uniref:Uncharacterized protein n=1 Tax=Pseudomicrostroma glucosiphilum TaxID=1684307 RepID=A0A316UGI2_9BASI|nr:hypothetical protein BCV69DRAFT_279952 [Pseudomicrostroma glucosiphilum]PWN24048.1 hypothetical protein BCV69DRAFT_279952 [Pseudomicrostroma glucosiphilum]
MAPPSRQASPLSLGSLSSLLASSLSSNDAVPSLTDLNELAKSLRTYKSELTERSSRIDRESARVSAYGASAGGSGSSSGSRARGQILVKSTDSSFLPDSSKGKGSPAPGAIEGQRPLTATRRQSGSAATRSKAPTPTAATPPPSSISTSARGKSKEPAISASSSKGKGVEKLPSASQAGGGSPVASPSPAASVTSANIPRPSVVKIKRERDRSASLLDDVQASSSTQVIAGDDVDDDAPPSGPGRTYAKNKRIRRSGSNRQESALRDTDDEQDGEDRKRAIHGRSPSVGSPSRNTPAGPSQTNGSPSAGQRSSGRPLGIRLKLNPQQAPSGITALGSAHQPTGLRPGGHAANGGPDGSGFIWTLPEEPAALIPQPPISRPPKAYPTRPDDVDEDFTAMDWKERERQRDREETYTANASASASPAPGQTHLHKEIPGAAISAAAANRVRSQNQQQVTYLAFQAYVDGWFKSLTEEDVAWLGRQEDDAEPFQIPEIGRHYKEVWEEEDANGGTGASLYGAPDMTAINGSRNGVLHKPKPTRVGPFDPRQLADEHAFGTSAMEAKGGPLTERVLSLVLPTPPAHAHSSQGQQQANGSGEQQQQQQQAPLVNGSASASAAAPPAVNGLGSHNEVPSFSLPPPHTQNMAQYEERLKAELRFLDILGPEEEVDWSNRQDDEISATLRKVQVLLGKQTKINTARKTRLKELAEGRLAYQDYLSCLTNVEKVIEQGWYKRQSLLKKFVSKKKGSAKASGSATGTGAGAGGNTRANAVPVINEHNTRSGTPSSAKDGNSALNAAAALMASVGGGGGESSSTSGVLTPLGATPTTTNGQHPSSPAPGGLPTDLPSGDAPPPDPYAAYNALALNRLGVPPLAPTLVEAMRSREMLKRALEPIFPPEVKCVPKRSIYEGLDIGRVEIEEE